MSAAPTRHANTIIFPASLDPKAVSVVRRLNEAGFETYLVGGCVRDLLLGRIPKDFDVSTAARPRQIRRTFRNCRVIGRRFKLAHVHFGEQIIEVATFRRNPFDVLEGGEAQEATDELDDADDHGPLADASAIDEAGQGPDDEDDDAPADVPRGRRAVRLDGDDDDDDDEESRRGRRGRRRRPREREGDGTPHAEADGLLIVRDNVYGSAEEDALRRDFTINALLYDVATDEVIDYVGGVADLDARTLRTIGDAKTRLAEDPVRMLRAVKFTARLGLHLDDALDAAMRECAPLIEQSSPPRVLEEIFKLLSCGRAEDALAMLAEYGLFARLLPEIAPYWTARPDALRRTGAALDVLDAGQRRVGNAFMLAALFHDPWRAIVEDGDVDPVAALYDLVTPAARRMSIPRRDVAILKQLFMTLSRFERARKSRRFRMRDFLARSSTVEAIDFLGLLARAGSADPEVHARWVHKLAEQLGADALMARAPEASPVDDDEPDERAARDGDGEGGRGRRKRRRRGGRGRRRGGQAQDERRDGRGEGAADGRRDGRRGRPEADRGPRRDDDASRAADDEAASATRESGHDGEEARDPSGAAQAPRSGGTGVPAEPAEPAPSAETSAPSGLRGFLGRLKRRVLGEAPAAAPGAPAAVEARSSPAPAATAAPAVPAEASPADAAPDERHAGSAASGSDEGTPADGGRPSRRKRRRRRRGGGGASRGGGETSAAPQGGEPTSADARGDGAAPSDGAGRTGQRKRRRKRGGGPGSSGEARGGGASRPSGGEGAKGEGAKKERKTSEGGKRRARSEDDEGRPGSKSGQFHPEDVEDLFDW